MPHGYKAIGLVVAQDHLVIITGERGTDQELVARTIRQDSNRSGRTFLALTRTPAPWVTETRRDLMDVLSLDPRPWTLKDITGQSTAIEVE